MSFSNARLEKVLSTVVENGLRSGWLSLGHQDGFGEVMPLLEAKKAARDPGQVAGQAGGERIAGVSVSVVP